MTKCSLFLFSKNPEQDNANHFDSLEKSSNAHKETKDETLEDEDLDNGGHVVFCEFCYLEFSQKEFGSRRKDRWRMHIYSKHLKSKIDEAIKESATNCPIENCHFETKNPSRQLIIQHYIGKRHGILEKLIGKKYEKYDQFALNTSCFWGSTVDQLLSEF